MIFITWYFWVHGGQDEYIALDFSASYAEKSNAMYSSCPPWTQKYHVMNIMNSREEIRLVENSLCVILLTLNSSFKTTLEQLKFVDDIRFGNHLRGFKPGLEITGGHHCGGETFQSIYRRIGWKYSKKSLIHSDDRPLFPVMWAYFIRSNLLQVCRYGMHCKNQKSTTPLVIFDHYFKAFYEVTMNKYIIYVAFYFLLSCLFNGETFTNLHITPHRLLRPCRKFDWCRWHVLDLL